MTVVHAYNQPNYRHESRLARRIFFQKSIKKEIQFEISLKQFTRDIIQNATL